MSQTIELPHASARVNGILPNCLRTVQVKETATRKSSLSRAKPRETVSSFVSGKTVQEAFRAEQPEEECAAVHQHDSGESLVQITNKQTRNLSSKFANFIVNCRVSVAPGGLLPV